MSTASAKHPECVSGGDFSPTAKNFSSLDKDARYGEYIFLMHLKSYLTVNVTIACQFDPLKGFSRLCSLYHLPSSIE